MQDVINAGAKFAFHPTLEYTPEGKIQINTFNGKSWDRNQFDFSEEVEIFLYGEK